MSKNERVELDTKILQKNLEITKLTKQLDNLTSNNVDLKEQMSDMLKHREELKELKYMYQQTDSELKSDDGHLLELLKEIHERMYPMMEYCERLQPVKVNSDSSDKYKGTIDLTDEDEMMMTKLFRLVDKDEMTNYDDQTSRSILKDLRKVIKHLNRKLGIDDPIYK